MCSYIFDLGESLRWIYFLKLSSKLINFLLFSFYSFTLLRTMNGKWFNNLITIINGVRYNLWDIPQRKFSLNRHGPTISSTRSCGRSYTTRFLIFYYLLFVTWTRNLDSSLTNHFLKCLKLCWPKRKG